MIRAFLLGLLLTLLLGLPRAAGARDQDPIRELPQGSWIEAAEPLLIPAGTWDLPFPAVSSELRCKLRMRQARPFARVLPRGARLKVEGVRQAGFTARRAISTFSFIELDSESVQDVSCSGAVRATVGDLRRALGRRMALKTGEQAGIKPVEIR